MGLRNGNSNNRGVVPMRRVGLALAAATAIIPALASASPAQATPVWNPTTFVSPAGISAESPQIALDAHGNAIAVWVVSDTNNEVVYSDHPAGGGWTPPAALSDPAEEAGSPRVAFDAHGDAFVAWTQGNGNNIRIRASYRPAGGSWQATPDVLSAANVESVTPTLAVDGSGDEAIGWVQNDAGFTHTTMYGDYKPAGGAWTTPQALSETTTTQLVEQPAGTFDSQGNATFVWVYDFTGGHAVIETSTYVKSSGVWSPLPGVELSNSSHDAVGPQIASDHAGDLSAVWEDSTTPGPVTQIMGADRPSGMSWKPAQAVETATGPNSGYASVAFDPAGDTVAAWRFVDNSGNARIQTSTRAAGVTSWPANGTDLTGNVYNPKSTTLAVGPNGDVILAWVAQATSTGSYLASAAFRPATGSWSSVPARALSDEGADAENPAVAIDGGGNAVVLWDRSDGSNFRIQGATYSGPSITSTSIPSTGVVGQPVSFSANPLDVWSPLTTTWSFGDGTTATGTSVTHVFTSTGTKTVSVSTVNAELASATASGSIAIVPVPTGPGGGPGGGLTTPAVTNVSESNRAWARANRLAHLSAKRKTPIGTTFSLTLNEAASIRFAFSRTVAGHRAKRRCVAGAPRGSGRRACKLTVGAGTLTLSGHAGADKVAFFGQLSRRTRLPKGSFALSITATAGGKTSAPMRLSFKIVA